MANKPILIFDTSGINKLADDPDADGLIVALRSGFYTRFTFTNILEIVANACGERRRKLLGVCKRLLCSGDCMDPQKEIIRKLAARFEQSSPFEWRGVDVRFPDAEREIARRDNFSDELAEKEREDARACKSVFNRIHDRAAFDALRAAGHDRAPSSVAEWVAQLQVEGGPFWTLARKLYKVVAEKPVDEPTIRRFVGACPPFHAWMIAYWAAQWNRCLRPHNVGPALNSGRNDVIMSACLPYCDQLVTGDSGQLECYREVVSICRLNVTVRWYGEFVGGLLLVGPQASSAAS